MMQDTAKKEALRQRAAAIYAEAGQLLRELESDGTDWANKRKRTEELLEEYAHKY